MEFYTLLYPKQFNWQSKLDGLYFNSIGVEKASWLERDFEVVKSLNGNTTLDPDGVFLAFFQSCWVVLKEDVMNVFHKFEARGKFEKSLDAYFIALIPKKVGMGK